MTLSNEVLMAYADGELDAQTRAQVEDAIAADPEVARRVAAHAAIRQIVHSGFEKVLDEPVPDRLTVSARKAVAARPIGRVIPFRPGAASRYKLPHWAALAASFLFGAIVLQFGSRLYAPGPVNERDGQMFASGTLAQALSNQLAGDQTAQSVVHIGVSFHSKSGEYCRTFQFRQQSVLAGLACHEGETWKLEVLTPGQPLPSAQSEYQQAAASTPPAITETVNATIDGEPLDASGEAAARTSHWHTPR